jgi:hypothetical protein
VITASLLVLGLVGGVLLAWVEYRRTSSSPVMERTAEAPPIAPARTLRASGNPGLATYFARVADGRFRNRLHNELNLLDAEVADRISDQMLDHPVIRELGGLVLDDPDTSNFHVCVGWPPLRGQVFYLDHDGDSRVVFTTLEELLAAAEQALATGATLREMHPATSPRAVDPAALALSIEHRVMAGADDGLAEALIPSMELTDLLLLRRLVTDEDFFVAQAIGDAIAARPSGQLLPIAQVLALHPHPQASEAGRRALEAIAAAGAR